MVDLRFDCVSKRYRIQQNDSRKGLLAKLCRMSGKEFWAVKDVSFEVGRGEALGIIGHNGAGKSTVLKLMSSITAPTIGTITINGRISALLEVGSGFHPELTGRENVFLSGSILGMKRREIAAKLDDIVSFAEVQQFIDVPVKRYSSGMFVRLGFAIAAHLEPDILLLDEVLAVGDAAFQNKCIERVLKMKEAGTTIIFISHDLSAVERLCSRVLLMKQGAIVSDGTAVDTIAKYRKIAVVLSHAEDRGGRMGGARIKSLEFLSPAGKPNVAFQVGEAMRVCVRYEAQRSIRNALVVVHFYPLGRELACQFSTFADGHPLDLEVGEGAVEFHCPEVGLAPGIYAIAVSLEQHGAGAPVDLQTHCATISVAPGKNLIGQFLMPHSWQIVRNPVRQEFLVEESPADNRI